MESPTKAAQFYTDHSRKFAKEHPEDLKAFHHLRHKEHILENHTASTYFYNKYRLTVSTTVYYVLLQFLQKKDDEGGSVIEGLLHTHVDVKTKDPISVGSQQLFAALLAHGEEEQDFPDEDEGIPGHNPGSTRVDSDAPTVLPRVQLGPRPMEAELEEDLRGDLAEEDEKNPPEVDQKSLIEELDQQIKLEPNDEAPDPSLVPLPKPLARDVQLEVQKIKEIRNGMKIPPRSSGVGPGVSICMLTFHNTFDR